MRRSLSVYPTAKVTSVPVRRRVPGGNLILAPAPTRPVVRVIAKPTQLHREAEISRLRAELNWAKGLNLEIAVRLHELELKQCYREEFRLTRYELMAIFVVIGFVFVRARYLV